MHTVIDQEQVKVEAILYEAQLIYKLYFPLHA